MYVLKNKIKQLTKLNRVLQGHLCTVEVSKIQIC